MDGRTSAASYDQRDRLLSPVVSQQHTNHSNFNNSSNSSSIGSYSSSAATPSASTNASSSTVHIQSDSANSFGKNTIASKRRRIQTRIVSGLDSYFHVTQLGSSFRQEFLGGLSTFLVCVYILQFESVILSDAGMPPSGVFAATCVTAGVGSIAMGLIARVPIIVAPGMGLNFFFAHVLVDSLGVDWRDALGLVFTQGILLAILAFFGIRSKVLQAFGTSIRIGVALGVVLFLAFTGMDRIDLLAKGSAGVFVPSFRLVMAMATMFLIVLLLVKYQMKSAFVVGIVVCTIVSVIVRAIWCPAELALEWDTPALSEVAFHLKFSGWDFRAFYLIPLLLLHHLFDSVATILSVLQMAYLGFKRPQDLVTSSSRFSTADEFAHILANSKQARNALVMDALTSSFGALMGVSCSVSYIESAIGVAVGARTGIAAIVAGLLFLSGLLLRPIYLLVPPEATGPVLFLTAVMTFPMINLLDLHDYMSSLPALFAAWVIPFTRSIGTGAALGFILEVISLVARGKGKNPIVFVLGILAVGEIVLFLILYIERDDSHKVDHHNSSGSVGRTCNNLA